MAIQRTRNIYNPKSSTPFALSRSKLENFLSCPRCFYLDRRLGIGRPSMPGFTLNTAVDALLKKEFDAYRATGEPHPIMHAAGLDAVPFAHDDLDEWRSNFRGVRFHHTPTNFLVTGAVDDLWVTPDNTLLVVDYKATSTESPITLDGPYKGAYKRQMEIYQWLLRQNGFAVSDTGYFVYVNGRKDRAKFGGALEFESHLIPYTGNATWVEDALLRAHATLCDAVAPDPDPSCEYCAYTRATTDAIS